MKNIINLQKRGIVGHRGVKRGGQLVKIGGAIGDHASSNTVVPSGLTGFKSSSRPPQSISLPKNPTSTVVHGAHQVHYGGAMHKELGRINFSNRHRNKKDENVKFTI